MLMTEKEYFKAVLMYKDLSFGSFLSVSHPGRIFFKYWNLVGEK